MCLPCNADVVTPVCGLAPNHTCEKALDLLTSLYLREQEKDIPRS